MNHLGQSEMSELDRLVTATQDAIKCCEVAAEAIRARAEALDRVREALGYGDRLAAIHNAHKRIGELMTEGQS